MVNEELYFFMFLGSCSFFGIKRYLEFIWNLRDFGIPNLEFEDFLVRCPVDSPVNCFAKDVYFVNDLSLGMYLSWLLKMNSERQSEFTHSVSLFNYFFPLSDSEIVLGFSLFAGDNFVNIWGNSDWVSGFVF